MTMNIPIASHMRVSGERKLDLNTTLLIVKTALPLRCQICLKDHPVGLFSRAFKYVTDVETITTSSGYDLATVFFKKFKLFIKFVINLNIVICRTHNSPAEKHQIFSRVQ